MDKKIIDDPEMLKSALKATHKPKNHIPLSSMLSSGSTLVNVACSGRTAGCYIKGHYYYYVGDSNSGKTWFCLSALAEACINDNFAGYDLIYNNVEQGVLMDIERYFGKAAKKRIQFIGTPMIEEFYDDINRRIESGVPFIYILDSQDALGSEEDEKKFKKQRSARVKGTIEKGQMSDGKAKKHSAHLRRVVAKLKDSGSILIIVGQAKDDMGPMAMPGAKRHSGGRSLKFYATLQLWTSKKGSLKKKFKDKDREQGTMALIKVKKNRITGRDRAVTIPIYHSYGIDDIGSCVDYLVSEGHWKKPQGVLKAPEFDFSGSREKLIAKIEAEETERDLRVLVSKVWNGIEDACSVKRKSRYE